MVDVVSIEKRSQMMSGIKGKDTQPEVSLRKELYARGYRYRKHGKGIKGKPDLVLKKYNALIFVHGCFWHGHENCKLFRLPKSRIEFWVNKIEGNITRDHLRREGLLQSGWRVLTVWECSLKNGGEKVIKTADLIERWLLSDDLLAEIRMDENLKSTVLLDSLSN